MNTCSLGRNQRFFVLMNFFEFNVDRVDSISQLFIFVNGLTSGIVSESELSPEIESIEEI